MSILVIPRVNQTNGKKGCYKSTKPQLYRHSGRPKKSNEQSEFRFFGYSESVNVG